MDRPCCRVALHPKHAEIDRLLANPHTSPLRVATQYGIPKSNVYRHKEKHLPKSLVRASDAAQVAQADGLMAQVRELMEEARTLQETATRKGDIRAAVAALRCRLEHLELLCRLSGELNPNPQYASVTVMNVFDEATALRMAQVFVERHGHKSLDGECTATK